MKPNRITVLLLLLCSLSCLVINVRADNSDSIPMHRLYNPNTGEHFYTGSSTERDNLVFHGWNYEGIAWNAPIYNGSPVYRLYNPNSGDHHYTMSDSERDWLVSLGWSYEGVAWNSAPSTAIAQFRLWNPNADLGSHHYTSSIEELNHLTSLGWIHEGIGWFGLEGGAHKHQYTQLIISPTCTAEGYTIYKCTCGDSYNSDKVAATGHEWNDWTVTKEATTESEGVKARTCKHCEATETEAIPKKEAETIDPSALASYGNSYARSLGFTVDSGIRAGYFPPDTIAFTTMAAAKSNVAANVRVLYDNIMARDGSVEGYRACVTVSDNGDGTYTVTVYYG